MQYTDIRFPHLGIVLSHVGRYISIGNFQIMFYGIIIACGFLAGLVVAQQEAKRTGQNPEIYMDYLLWMMIPAIIMIIVMTSLSINKGKDIRKKYGLRYKRDAQLRAVASLLCV